MILTDKEIADHWEAIPPCKDDKCDVCLNSKVIANSEFFTSLLLCCYLTPSLIPMVISKSILVGIAIAETKKLEEMVK